MVFEDTEIGLKAAHSAGMDCMLLSEQQLQLFPCEVKNKPL
ncbi:hypothetical protein JCM19238_3871 [Vibrio ponticus]|nr:hypothetical protein JCM19238_3871 [Vibrio ponticus]